MEAIKMTVVPEQMRLDFLPGKIGRYKVVFELLIYQHAECKNLLRLMD